MAYFIHNGMLWTQSDRGDFRGDILWDEDGIRAVGPSLDVSDVPLEHVVEAENLYVCPGLIDAHMHLIRAADRLPDDLTALGRVALAAGVTTAALWQGDGEDCLIRHGEQAAEAPRLVRLQAEEHTDAELRDVMARATEEGVRLGCEAHSPALVRRLLRLRLETGCALILTHLTDCGDMLGELIAAGCPVILGANSRRGSASAYALAARLQRAGLTVALTGDYPSTRLHHLPINAGLCVREGLTAREALRTVTRDAAKLLGIDRATGSIEPGKRADFALYDGDPLKLASARVMTVCGGVLY